MRVFSFAMRSPFIRNTVKEQWSSCSFKAFAMRSSFKSGPDLWFEKRVNVHERCSCYEEQNSFPKLLILVRHIEEETFKASKVCFIDNYQ